MSLRSSGSPRPRGEILLRRELGVLELAVGVGNDRQDVNAHDALALGRHTLRARRRRRLAAQELKVLGGRRDTASGSPSRRGARAVDDSRSTPPSAIFGFVTDITPGIAPLRTVRVPRQRCRGVLRRDGNG